MRVPQRGQHSLADPPAPCIGRHRLELERARPPGRASSPGAQRPTLWRWSYPAGREAIRVCSGVTICPSPAVDRGDGVIRGIYRRPPPLTAASSNDGSHLGQRRLEGWLMAVRLGNGPKRARVEHNPGSID